jgi:hypothetical protein
MFRPPFAAQVQIPMPAPDLGHIFEGTEVFDSHPMIDAWLAPATRHVPTQIERLAEIRFRMHSSGAPAETISRADELIVTLDGLSKEIEQFITEQRQAHVAKLEAKRADVWKQCREAETEVQGLLYEGGRLSGAMNVASQALSAARSAAAAAREPNLATRFPDANEIAAADARRVAADLAVSRAASVVTDSQQHVYLNEGAQSTAAKELRELVEQLHSVDRELEAARRVK